MAHPDATHTVDRRWNKTGRLLDRFPGPPKRSSALVKDCLVTGPTSQGTS